MIAATAPIAMKAVQFISRSKFFGLPFEARFPMTAAAVGANTKNASTTNAASANARMSDCVMEKNSQVRRMTSIESITSVGVINEVRGNLAPRTKWALFGRKSGRFDHSQFAFVVYRV